MSLTWRNKAFQITKTQGGFMAHCVDGHGVIIFRWRLYYDEENFEEFNVPFGIVEHFETFKALCRQFETPHEARDWLLAKVQDNDRKQVRP